MFDRKIRKIISKKLLFYSFVLIFIITVTLAFVPHYSCACGEMGEKADGSMFRFLVINPAKDIAKDIERIFK